MKCYLFLLLFILSSCALDGDNELHPSGLEITEINPSRDSHIMKQNVLQIAQVYDLSPFLYTKKIQIKTDAVPQSHPVLTLNIRYTNYPHKILAVLLHEEFHWWTLMKKNETALVTADLKKIFPGQTPSVYNHLVVCHLEYEALKLYLGEKASRQIIQDFIRKEKLRPWTYSQVLLRPHIFKKILKKHNLTPAPLS